MSIAKKYQPGEIEEKWYDRWIQAGAFRSTPDERTPYTIAIPPPNVTGILHMGHVLNNTLQDVLIRRKRMQGFNACWVPGTDHASIATEAKVVRMLREQGIKKSDLSREAFLEHAFAWKDKYGGIILQQLRKLGASCDWDRTTFTMDEGYSEAVIQVFCDLYDKGHIYRDLRMVNWDPAAQTTVSDEEVIYQDTQGALYHVRYPIEGSEGEFVTIATTRPETILADTAIAINPDDPRYTHLHGKRAIVPLTDRAIPIITDGYVDLEFGTGCLKVTPAHDPNDYEIGQRHGLEVIDMFEADGTIAPTVGRYTGMDRFDVRKQITRDLDEAGFLVKKEPYTHAVGHSERTHAVIEPRLSLQWFLNMKELAQPALQAVLDGEVSLIPGKFINTYKHWMENVRDWCLSRQLWWGHRIPAYYIQGSDDYVVAPTPEAALAKARALTGNPDLSMDSLHQDEDVLDTWASSWLWPIQIFNGINEPDNPDIQYYYPTQDLVTAPEILFFWVARMIMAGYEYRDQKPFANVYLTGIVRDDQRRKMSKSLGNSPDPLDLIAQYGADGVRVGMLLASPAGNDLLYKESLVEQGRNFANKIWNAFRLIKSWEVTDAPAGPRERLALDWMQARLEQAAAEIEDHFSKFRISDALMSGYKLTWDDFCSWFLEMIKPAYGQPIARETLEGAIDQFEATLKLLHPFMPFITEEIWHGLRDRAEGDFICLASMPTGSDAPPDLLADIELVKETVTAVRAFRTQKGLSPKDPIDLFILTDQPDHLTPYFPLLEKFLNTGELAIVSEKVEQAASLRVGTYELYIPLDGTIDLDAERAKIQEEIAYMEGFLKQVLKKLGNERFVQNAPEQVVALERKKQADAEAKLDVLRKSLSELG
ncbi:MAG: valine--tRNA ligase [Bacteroidetes bacterium]|nr:MAG: valine--tRNA ligase [Bacteroidota bacterium]